ncbi:MAG: DUF2961 domain-containing protein [Chloroflexi bacterium]|nr:DUF2961 domain-containing protein [Chloroflexota bacterium]
MLRSTRSRRVSSYDRSGGNRDFFTIAPGETKTLAAITGAGCITHVWTTIACRDPFHLRKLVLRMWWDGEDNPSVEVPVGDFFGLGHAQHTYFVSLPLQMFDRGFNCWFPMPFSHSATVSVQNEADSPATYYFYIDYEEYNALEGDAGRFHAQWRRERPTTVRPPDGHDGQQALNTSGRDNYLVLEAEGRGHYVGCHIDVDLPEPGWWGEGDDMFFIDGEQWPPALHGTGTEDYFCGAWNYNALKQTFCTPYFGYHFKTNADYTGKHSQYRFHIEDPVRFEKSLRFSIEHGHANDRQGDWSSTAYWYQTEPHKLFPTLPAAGERLPYRWGGIERWS